MRALRGFAPRVWPQATLVLMLVAVASCRYLGLPAIALQEVSPAGGHVAEVVRRPSLDPPRQSLWLTDLDGGNRTRLLDLAEDQDWCDEIVWSDDGSTLAFVVQRSWVALFDAESREPILRAWLTERDSYPTRDELRDVSLSRDGSSLRYRLCDRATGSCTEPLEYDVALSRSMPASMRQQLTDRSCHGPCERDARAEPASPEAPPQLTLRAVRRVAVLTSDSPILE